MEELVYVSPAELSAQRRWRVAACLLFLGLCAALVGSISAARTPEALGDWVGATLGLLLIIGAPGAFLALVIPSNRTKAFLVGSGALAAVLLFGAVARTGVLGNARLASEAAATPGASQHNERARKANLKPYHGPVIVDPYRAPEVAAAPPPQAADPEWDAAIASFMTSNCEFRDPSNAELLSRALQFYKDRNPTANDVDLIAPAGLLARQSGSFQGGAGCG